MASDGRFTCATVISTAVLSSFHGLSYGSDC